MFDFKLQITPLCVKKFANNELFDSFFALIGIFFILFPTVPELCKNLLNNYPLNFKDVILKLKNYLCLKI